MFDGAAQRLDFRRKVFFGVRDIAVSGEAVKLPRCIRYSGRNRFGGAK